eukprot:13803196-Heterocapsa_arctica.AAC.1
MFGRVPLRVHCQQQGLGAPSPAVPWLGEAWRRAMAPSGQVRLSEHADICRLLSPSAYRGVGGRAFGCSEMGCPTILPIALG